MKRVEKSWLRWARWQRPSNDSLPFRMQSLTRYRTCSSCQQGLVREADNPKKTDRRVCFGEPVLAYRFYEGSSYTSSVLWRDDESQRCSGPSSPPHARASPYQAESHSASSIKSNVERFLVSNASNDDTISFRVHVPSLSSSFVIIK
jgi:hypothetical protein